MLSEEINFKKTIFLNHINLGDGFLIALEFEYQNRFWIDFWIFLYKINEGFNVCCQKMPSFLNALNLKNSYLCVILDFI